MSERHHNSLQPWLYAEWGKAVFRRGQMKREKPLRPRSTSPVVSLCPPNQALRNSYAVGTTIIIP